MIRFQQKLGIDVIVGPKNFTWNQEKGFYCFGECLVKGKGRTRGKSGIKMNNDAQVKLQSFYKNYNSEFFKMFNKEYDW